MKYTLAEGVDMHQEDTHRRLLVSIPIVAALLFLALLGIQPDKQKPVVGPALTSASAASKNSSSPTTKKTAKSSSASPNPQTASAATGGTSLAATTSNPQLSTSSGGGSGSGSVSPPPVVGGRGGGSGGGTTNEVVCDNSSGVLPITCSVCSPPIVVPIGQKVLLGSSGSCTLIN